MVYLAIKNGWIFPWRTVSHNQVVNLHSFTCDTTLATWNVSETFQKHQGYFSSYPMTDPAGAGILMLTWLGYIDGIHGAPYIAAPWIPWVLDHDPFMSSTWYGSVSKPCTPSVHIKIAGKWMFIPLKMVLIGIDPYPYGETPNLISSWSAIKNAEDPRAPTPLVPTNGKTLLLRRKSSVPVRRYLGLPSLVYHRKMVI